MNYFTLNTYEMKREIVNLFIKIMISRLDINLNLDIPK